MANNMPNLKAKYQAEVAPALMQKFGYKSTMQIPRLDKIVINVGCSEARENPKVLDAVVRDLTTIAGQQAVITKAKIVNSYSCIAYSRMPFPSDTSTLATNLTVYSVFCKNPVKLTLVLPVRATSLRDISAPPRSTTAYTLPSS